MNQAQRTFLINKLKESARDAIRALKEPERPSMHNYLFHAIMKDELRMQSELSIMTKLKERALASKEGYSWLEEERRFGSFEGVVKIKFRDFFILPDDFEEIVQKYEKEFKAYDEAKNTIQNKCDSLCIRIQLASDKTLQRMIDEVDDMGDISLLDTKLRLLTQ